MRFAVVGAVVALLCALAPSASAEGVAGGWSGGTRDGVSVAAVEFNEAVAGTPPAGLPCVSVTGARACFEADGDKWWVRDTAADSASAEARWDNYRNGSLYRSGICRNGLGNGTWGVCNKNYYEDSTLVYIACVFDASEGRLVRCS
ncbi:hypothetical protein ACFV4N_18885 [Actinosynnema sp. NPDC059797]